MKKYHRKFALKSKYNIEVINWTVDPLLTNNANLNFAKLGCICSTYYVDYYGDPELVGIYSGVPTDRFFVKWYIRDERVKRRMENYMQDRIDKDLLLNRSPCINVINGNQWVKTKSFNELSCFTLQIPGDYQKLKEISIELAIDWRIQFRNFCLEYFSTGWQVIDFHTFKIDSMRENYYEFSKIKEN